MDTEMESEAGWANNTNLTQSNMIFHYIRQVDSIPERCTELLETAYETTLKFASSPDLVSWITEDKIEKMDLSLLTEKDIFVFGEFRGQLFDKLASLIKPVILGPICVIECFLKELSLPPVPGPIYSMCLRDTVITTSGLDTEQRAEIMKLVNYMGGNYQSSLLEIGTHLITETVTSEKYEKAAIQRMYLVLPKWIYYIWENSTNPKFNLNESVDKFKVPIFHNLSITVTNLSRERKMKVKKLIQENGGTFHSCYDPKIINIVITEMNNTNSEKYKAAMKQRKICLTPEWIFESVENGFALQIKDYLVKQSGTVLNSTVKPNARNLMFDCSVLSEIHADDRDGFILHSSSQSMNSEASLVEKRLDKLIDFEAVRSAGKSFLDGCYIFFIGFANEDKDLLNKIIHRGGAVRLDTISDDVTHIIVGDRLTTNEEREIRNKFPNKQLLKYDWLLESIKIKQPANEDMFTYAAKEVSLNMDPITKRKKDMTRDTESFVSPKQRITRAKRNLETSLEPTTSGVSNTGDLLLNRHLNKNKVPALNHNRIDVPSSSKNNQQSIPTTSSAVFHVPLFVGLTFYIMGFEEESHAQFEQDLISKFGTVISNPSEVDEVDYVVVPVDDIIDLDKIPIKHKHIVNFTWLDDSVKVKELVPIEYYHRPIIFPAYISAPLIGLTIVISGYLNSERIFLKYLSDILGATGSEQYRKCDCPILLCPTASGSKYVGAIKWGFPVVTKDWLLECYKRKSKCPLEKFIVGDSEVSDQFLFEELEKEDALDGMETETIQKHDISTCDNELSEYISRFNSLGDELKELATNTDELLNQIAARRDQRAKELKEDEAKVRAILATEPNDEIDYEDVDRNWKEEGISTPDRKYVIDLCKEYEAQMTPNTKKMDKLFDRSKLNFSSPETPDDVKPSAIRFWHSSETKILESIPVKPETPPTPMEELGRVFWAKRREVLNKSRQTGETNHSPVKRVLDFTNTDGNKRSLLRATSPQLYLGTDSIPLQEIGGTDQDIEMGYPLELNPICRSENSGMRHRGTPVFGFSGYEAIENFDQIISNIKSIGGKLGTNNGMVPCSNCTHIIAVQLKRSAKILTAIAAGKWVMSLDYIKESIKAGKFLNEEFFEWGNSMSKLKVETELEQQLAGAAYKWRKLIKEQNEKGPFSYYRAIVLMDTKEDFSEIITAGGGEILDVKKPFSRCPTALSATHCFMNKKKSAISSSDYKALAEAGVHAVNIKYLNDILLGKEAPDIKKYLISPP